MRRRTPYRGSFVPLLIALASVAGGAVPAEAQFASCSYQVTDMSFGSSSILPTPQIDATSTIQVTCQALQLLSDIRVCLSLPAGSGGNSVLDRRMVNGDRSIQYQLYTGPTRQVEWGEYQGQGTMVNVDFLGLNIGLPVTQTVTVYGRLFGGQTDLRAGNYESILIPTARWERSILGSFPSCGSISDNATSLPPISVQFELEPSCTVAASPLDFGTVTSLAAGHAATTNLAVTCTLGALYTVALDGGTVTQDPQDRKMQLLLGSATIDYQLFRDVDRTQPWGDTPGSILEGVGTGIAQSISIYGWVPPQGLASIGTYQDVVTVTVQY